MPHLSAAAWQILLQRIHEGDIFNLYSLSHLRHDCRLSSRIYEGLHVVTVHLQIFTKMISILDYMHEKLRNLIPQREKIVTLQLM